METLSSYPSRLRHVYNRFLITQKRHIFVLGPKIQIYIGTIHQKLGSNFQGHLRSQHACVTWPWEIISFNATVLTSTQYDAAASVLDAMRRVHLQFHQCPPDDQSTVINTSHVHSSRCESSGISLTGDFLYWLANLLYWAMTARFTSVIQG